MLVPRTRFLTDVASEGVAFEMPGDAIGERAAMLDRRVADAILGYDRAIRKNRVGRTGVDATRAGAASIGDRRAADIVFERGQQCSDGNV